MTSWQPIETAPMHSEALLLFCPDGCDSSSRPEGMVSNIVVGRWRGRTWDCNSGGWICDVTENDFGYYPGEFSQTAIYIHPSHWMPLPSAPVNEATDREGT